MWWIDPNWYYHMICGWPQWNPYAQAWLDRCGRWFV